MKRASMISLGVFLTMACPYPAPAMEADAVQPAETADFTVGTVQVTVPVTEDTQFGAAVMEMTVEDFNAIGFQYGDSCDVSFSSGYTLEDIPYYTGYYTKVNAPLICAYPGLPLVRVAFTSGDFMWDKAGCQPGDTVTVTLSESGKYADVQEAMNLAYIEDRADYPDDAAFGNFRPLSGGGIDSGRFYRGASGLDNTYGRAPVVDGLLREHGIRCVLDLADSPEEAEAFMAEPDFESEYYRALYEEGNVICLDLSASYRSAGFMEKLTENLREMMKKEGPFYIHCTEGKDRGGFVSLLLEALSGADREELEADYMKTYENYYGVSEDTDPDRYGKVRELTFDDMFAWLCSVGQSMDMSIADPQTGARAYLRKGGMTEEEIDAFTDFLAAE